MRRRWREAMADALYSENGFFRRPDTQPADHFRTSAHTGTAFAGAIGTALAQVDALLEYPDRLDLVDIGAGRGELLTNVAALVTPNLRQRLNLVAVEFAPRPDRLAQEISWRPEAPESIIGLVIASEWLDNVPLDIAQAGRYVDVDEIGVESIGSVVATDDRAWLDRWWPDGVRAEIGISRDAAWAATIARIRAGAAIAIDYGHLRDHRPPLGTLSGFRNGREVEPVPDGTCDLTAHVAIDAVAAAGVAVAGGPATVLRQADALHALGVTGRRPDLALARTDPAGYVRALASASTAGELTDRAGLGDHFWICQPVAIRYGL